MNHTRVPIPFGLRAGALLSCIALPLLTYMPDYLLAHPSRTNIVSMLTPKIMMETTVLALILMFVVAYVYLRAMRQSFADIGLKLKRWHIQVGIGVGLALLLVVVSVSLSAVTRLFAGEEGFVRFAGQMRQVFENRTWIAAWIFTAVVRGGVIEETLRTYVLTRAEFAFDKAGLYAMLVVSSVMFGAMHGYEGYAAVFAAGGLGFILGLIFIRRRSLIEVVVAHAGYDMVALGALYILTKFGLPVA